MDYSDNKKTNRSDAVLTLDKPDRQLDIPLVNPGPTFDMPSYVGASPYKKKKRNKLKRSLWVCCTNVDIKKEKDVEKILEAFENNNGKKTCFAVCCSNVEVGTEA